MIIGYARTSTVDQMAGFESQITELHSIGCEKVFQEQVSSVGNRVQLDAALEFVREGDFLVVTKLDRLARLVRDLMSIIHQLERKQVGLRILNLGMDTKTTTGKLMLTILGVTTRNRKRTNPQSAHRQTQIK
jgi:DNA invertase Pin-like site-specific DNA recombinase